MATGTITSVVENNKELIFEVTIGNAKYLAIVSKIVFNNLLTNTDKQNYVISIISASRRVNKQLENVFPTLIGNVINIPD